MSRHRRLWSPLACQSWAILFLLWISLLNATALLGQVRRSPVLDRLPKEPGIYLWTDDLPTLLRELEDWPWPSLDEESLTRSKSNSANAWVLERLEQFREDWNSINESEFFAGEAGIYVSFDNSSPESSTSRNDFASEPTGIAVVARCQAGPEQFKELALHLNRLRPFSSESAWDDARQGKAETMKVPGSWKLVDGWFYWADREELLNRLIDFADNHSTSSKSIVDDLTLQTGFANLSSRPRIASHVSFYVTNEGLRWLLRLLENVSIFDGWLEVDSDVELFLSEMRGMAGKCSVASPKELNDEHQLLILDSFLVVTQPRHGVFAAIANENVENIDYNVPLLRYPLGLLMQVSFRNKGLAEAILEMTPTREDSQETSEHTSIFAPIDRFITAGYASLRGSSKPIVGGYHLRKGSDIDSFVSMYNLREIDIDKTSGIIRELGEQDVRFLGRSRKEIENAIQHNEAQLEELKAQIESKRDEARPSDPSAERSAERLEHLARMNEQFLRQLAKEIDHPNPTQMFARNWMLSWADSDWPEALGANVAKLFGETHPQLRDLKQEIESLAETLNCAPEAHGVFAVWIHPVRYFVELSPTDDIAGQDPTDERDARRGLNPPGIDPVVFLGQMFVARQLDKFFLAIHNEDDGFRIVGALKRVADQSE